MFPQTGPFIILIACTNSYADVIFLVDASYSIGVDDFQKVKEFIKDVVQIFDVGPSNTEVALIQYSSYADLHFKLDDYSIVTDLLDAIDNVTYSGGATLTSDAILMMRTQGFEGFVDIDNLDTLHVWNTCLPNNAKREEGVNLY